MAISRELENALTETDLTHGKSHAHRMPDGSLTSFDKDGVLHRHTTREGDTVGMAKGIGDGKGHRHNAPGGGLTGPPVMPEEQHAGT